MSLRRLAVVPARGGSTRLKNKNVLPLGGKPLVRHMAEAVVQSEAFDEVWISTDSDIIAAAVGGLGLKRHERPAEHATTRATVLDAMLQIVDHTEPFDVFAYFLPTCPFITAREIREGAEALVPEVDSVISMVEFAETMQLACRMQGDHVVPVFDNLTAGLTNSKYLSKYYKPSGAFYMSWWERLRETRNFFLGNVKGVIMDKAQAVDINDDLDLGYAEALWNSGRLGERGGR